MSFPDSKSLLQSCIEPMLKSNLMSPSSSSFFLYFYTTRLLQQRYDTPWGHFTGLAGGGALEPIPCGTGPCIPAAMGTRWACTGPRASIALGSRPTGGNADNFVHVSVIQCQFWEKEKKKRTSLTLHFENVLSVVWEKFLSPRLGCGYRKELKGLDGTHNESQLIRMIKGIQQKVSTTQKIPLCRQTVNTLLEFTNYHGCTSTCFQTTQH